MAPSQLPSPLPSQSTELPSAKVLLRRRTVRQRIYKLMQPMGWLIRGKGKGSDRSYYIVDPISATILSQLLSLESLATDLGVLESWEGIEP